MALCGCISCLKLFTRSQLNKCTNCRQLFCPSCDEKILALQVQGEEGEEGEHFCGHPCYDIHTQNKWVARIVAAVNKHSEE